MKAAASRLSLSTIDQAIWSVGNFGVSIGISQASSTVSSFAAYSVPLGLVMVSTGLIGAFTHEPILLVAERERQRYFAASVKLAALAGTGFGFLLTALLLLFNPHIPAAASFAFGLACPVCAVAETMRGDLILARSMRSLLGFDLIWTVVALSLIGVALWSDRSAALIVAAWVLGAAVGIAWQWRGFVALEASNRSVTEFVKSTHRPGAVFAVEYMVAAGLAQVLPLLVVGLSGAAQAGLLRIVQVAFGPVTTVQAAVRRIAFPEFRARVERNQSVAGAVAMMSLVLVAISIAWGLVLGAMGPGGGARVFGPSFAAAYFLLPIATIHRAVVSQAFAPAAWARSRSLLRESMSLRLATAAAVVAAASVGAIISGAAGVLVGTATVQGVATVAWWWIASRGSEGRPPKVGSRPTARV